MPGKNPMDVLLYGPDSKRAARIQENIGTLATIRRITTFNVLLNNLEKHFYPLIIIDFHDLSATYLSELLRNLTRLSDKTQIIGVCSKPVQDYNALIKPYRVMMLNADDGGNEDLTVLVKYFAQLDFKPDGQAGILPEDTFMGQSEPFRETKHKAERVKNSDLHVLITGETGTGKTELARNIHDFSNRKNAPFMHLNCASIPDNLLEAELFGYKQGAFTGALQDTKGKFEAAGNGTILLDEIGELPLALQSKLLNVLDEHMYYPVGDVIPVFVKARIIAATNKNLVEEIRNKRFREDLYYRLNIYEINIPPLRERREDIPLLFDYYLNKFALMHRARRPKVETGVYHTLQQYEWKGNVRELQNLINRLLFLNVPVIKPQHMPQRFFQSAEGQIIKEAERWAPLEKAKESYARYIYEKTRNKNRTARILQIDIKTLQKLLASSDKRKKR